MSVRMDATLYSDEARIERNNFLIFECTLLSQHSCDVKRYFVGCYYPRWHSFYLDEVRYVISNMGYPSYKTFHTFPLEVYLKDDGAHYLAEDFVEGAVMVIATPQNLRDDDTKRFKIVKVDKTHLQFLANDNNNISDLSNKETRTMNLTTATAMMQKSANSANKMNYSAVNMSSKAMLSTRSGQRVAVDVAEDVRVLLTQLKDAYIANVGGGIPEIGIKAMGRPFRKVYADGKRYMTYSGIVEWIRASRIFSLNALPSLSNTQREVQSIADMAEVIFNGFPQELLFDTVNESDERYNPSLNSGTWLGETANVVKQPWHVIDYDVVMDVVRGEMNAKRKSAVLNAFSKMDFDNDGYLKIHEIQALFNAQAHPVVVHDGLYAPDKLLRWFLSLWDGSNDQFGLIPINEFLDYYNGLSAVIDDDDIFVDILRTTWKLSPWTNSVPI